MIEPEHFFAALHVLSEVLPYQKQLSPETRNALWELFPPEAKRDLTPADLQWAVAQRLIDPDPPRETAISSVLIHYLYPKRDGWPALDAGPRRLDPRTAVRDERKVFRAEESRDLLLGVPSYPLPRTASHKPLPAEQLVRDPNQPWLGARPESFWRESTPIHNGGEGPDGTTPPIWTDPNWMGGSRNG